MFSQQPFPHCMKYIIFFPNLHYEYSVVAILVILLGQKDILLYDLFVYNKAVLKVMLDQLTYILYLIRFFYYIFQTHS